METYFDYQLVRSEFVKLYGAQIELNDPAHRLEHLDMVFENALTIKKKAESQGVVLDVNEIFWHSSKLT